MAVRPACCACSEEESAPLLLTTEGNITIIDSQEKCVSSVIMTSLNGSVKMSPYEKGDNIVESEGTAAIDGIEPGGAR